MSETPSSASTQGARWWQCAAQRKCWQCAPAKSGPHWHVAWPCTSAHVPGPHCRPHVALPASESAAAGPPRTLREITHSRFSCARVTVRGNEAVAGDGAGSGTLTSGSSPEAAGASPSGHRQARPLADELRTHSALAWHAPEPSGRMHGSAPGDDAVQNHKYNNDYILLLVRKAGSLKKN